MALCVAVGVAAATPWGSISPLLERGDEWGSSYLPTVPPSSDGASVYGTVASTHSNGFPFTTYTIDVDQSRIASDYCRTVKNRSVTTVAY